MCHVIFNFRDHRLKVDHTTCLLCFSEAETTDHVLKDCAFFATVWASVGLSIELVGTRFSSAKDWISNLLCGPSRPKSELCAITLWAIWNERNNRLKEGKGKSPEETSFFATNYLVEMEATRESNNTTTNELQKVWTPPKHPTIKLNVDTAVDDKRGRLGVGVVARTSTGEVIACLSSNIHGSLEPTLAECLAVEQAFVLAEKIKASNIWIEGDSLEAIKLIQDTGEDLSIIRPHLKAIKDRMKLLSHSIITHIRREDNRVAHTLARYALHIEVQKVWFKEAPFFIQAVIREEMLMCKMDSQCSSVLS
ncbi:Putative ribonuclease H protein [Apostasia shenzhenica]|uniref:Ribonuclease H protein n=1 Tax=Apostasia shenzhenica TaxID=1088818 RepID=A0A2H9ZTD9_9ASPA|nr:Putative ribonuclease H protein [Apostasia shenzhenica]